MAVRSAGQRFAFIKATEGAHGSVPAYVNPWFRTDWTGAGAAGLLRGAYHFAQPSMPADSALVQARDFVATTGSMQGAADLPPVLDVETANGLSPTDMVTWIATWLFEVERLTGRRPMIYSGLNFWNTQVGGSTAFAAYRLWFARYVAGSSPGQLPNGFLTWTFWQRSNTGSVPGVPATVVTIVSRASGNVIIEKAVLNVAERIREGRTMAEPLLESKAFPAMVVEMIGVGEQTGALDTMLNKIADFYEEEVDAAVGALTSLLEPLMMVFIGGIVGTILIAMYMPIFSMADHLAE